MNARFPICLPLMAACLFAQGAGDETLVDPLQTAKAIDDVMWRMELGDIAEVRSFRYTGKPRVAGGSPMILYAYSYIPKGLDRNKQHPLVVLIHGGVHSNHMTGGPANGATIVREMVERGYVVVAPDYRGSTGYGAAYAKAIDYGGKENDDVLGARDWMIARYPFLDSKRVGLAGWSHGGMIALFNLFFHPDRYACAYAGVPVSDLTERKKYLKSVPKTMEESAGAAAAEDPEEYRKRSAVTWVAKLERPLLVHGNTTDETVRAVEVNGLIGALQAAGKKFEYKMYEAAPGGHHFNRIDTALAVESRREIYEFLERYLKP